MEKGGIYFFWYISVSHQEQREYYNRLALQMMMCCSSLLHRNTCKEWPIFHNVNSLYVLLLDILKSAHLPESKYNIMHLTEMICAPRKLHFPLYHQQQAVNNHHSNFYMFNLITEHAMLVSLKCYSFGISKVTKK